MLTDMTYAIIGTGAIGGYYGAKLLRAGVMSTSCFIGIMNMFARKDYAWTLVMVILCYHKSMPTILRSRCRRQMWCSWA